MIEVIIMADKKDDELLSILENHVDKFDDFHDDWSQHRAEAKQAMAKIDAVHANSLIVAQNIAHLSQLPLIATSLSSLEKHTSGQVTNLIEQSAKSELGKTKLIERMMLICLAVVIFLGVTLIILFFKESNKSLKLGPGGVEIHNGNSQYPQREEKKLTP